MIRHLHTMLLAVIAVLFCIDGVHAQASGKPFATHGTEKMIYDARMEPQANDGLHAGSYHTVRPDARGENLHVGFVWKDERPSRDKRYKMDLDKHKRYNLYTLRLNIGSGKIYSLDGRELKQPLNKSRAKQCMVLDSDDYLTNMPSLTFDDHGNPAFLWHNGEFK